MNLHGFEIILAAWLVVTYVYIAYRKYVRVFKGPFAYQRKQGVIVFGDTYNWIAKVILWPLEIPIFCLVYSVCFLWGMVGIILPHLLKRAWHWVGVKTGRILVLKKVLVKQSMRSSEDSWVYSTDALRSIVAQFKARRQQGEDFLGEFNLRDRFKASTGSFFTGVVKEEASHKVLDLWLDGNWLCASIEVLPSERGALLRDFYESGEDVVFSIRSLGTSLVKQGDLITDAKLITIDARSFPF